MSDYIKREDAIKAFDPSQRRDWYTPWIVETLEDLPSVDAIPVELVAEMFGNDEPCNFGLFGIPVDDFMCFECGDWCESNCGKVPAVECWKKFFEAWEERKDDE